MTEGEIRENAARGARHLDQSHPAGWADRINVKTLDAVSREHCPLKQLHGMFGKGLVAELGGRVGDVLDEILWARLHGFMYPVEDLTSDLAPFEQAAILNAAWREEIAVRMALR